MEGGGNVNHKVRFGYQMFPMYPMGGRVDEHEVPIAEHYINNPNEIKLVINCKIF